MICSMEGFTFASTLNLNMGYYHIKLDVDAQKLCTIVFPWGKYNYKHLCMDIKIAWFLMFFKMSCLSLEIIPGRDSQPMDCWYESENLKI
jgi:hypothetical protein